jgi:hypothetical protein
MNAIINTLESVLGAAVLTLAPLVFVLFWDVFAGSAFLQSRESALGHSVHNSPLNQR